MNQAASAPDEARERLIGIALACAAVTIFTSLDTSAKFAAAHGISTLQIVWVRYAESLVLAALFLRPWATPALYKTAHPGAHVIRGLFLLGSTAFNFIAIQHLQLAQTISISFAGPLIVTAAAGPLLGEWAGPRRWAAVVVGFLGVLVVVQPQPGAFQPWALFSVATAFCNAGYGIWNRLMSSTESPGSMLIYGSLLSTVLLAPAVPFSFVWPTNGWVIFALLLTGVAGGIGHWFLILANRRAPATLLAPFSYVQLLSMIASGYLIFGDVPGKSTLAGALIIIASGLYVLYRERKRSDR